MNWKEALDSLKFEVYEEGHCSYIEEELDLAIKALEKQVPMKVVCDGDDESDYVYCPCCNEHIGSNDFVWEDFYARDWKLMHCVECGQAMIWK